MPKLPRPFFGWYIVAMAFLVSSVGIFASFYLLAVVQVPMSQALQIQPSLLISVVTLRTVVGLGVSPLIGRIADRPWGPRVLLVAGGTIGGTAVFATGFATALWQVFALQILVAVALTQTQILNTSLVARWFRRRRGLALSIATMGNSAGSIVLIPLASVLSDTAGWRWPWYLAGALVLVILVPSGLFFAKSGPEVMGLHIDGDQTGPDSDDATEKNPNVELQWTVRAAARTRSLWLLTATTSVVNFAVLGFIFAVPALAADRQLSGATKAIALSALPLGAASSRVAWGYVLGRLPFKTIYRITLAAMSACFLGIAITNDTTVFVVLAVVLGLLQGATVPLYSLTLADFFGTRSLGGIIGLTRPVSGTLSAFAPVLPSVVAELTGGFEAWLVGAALSIGAMFFVIGSANKPIPRADASISGVSALH